jgi:hypothetical protein
MRCFYIDYQWALIPYVSEISLGKRLRFFIVAKLFHNYSRTSIEYQYSNHSCNLSKDIYLLYCWRILINLGSFVFIPSMWPRCTKSKRRDNLDLKNNISWFYFAAQVPLLLFRVKIVIIFSRSLNTASMTFCTTSSSATEDRKNYIKPSLNTCLRFWIRVP